MMAVWWEPPGPPQKPRIVAVTLSLGEPETGVWCPFCLRPSAIRWPIIADKPLFFPAGRSAVICQDCGASLECAP